MVSRNPKDPSHVLTGSRTPVPVPVPNSYQNHCKNTKYKTMFRIGGILLALLVIQCILESVSFQYSHTLSFSGRMGDRGTSASSGVGKLRMRQSEREVLPLTATPPMKVMLLVEPTPFNYVSGYANRFKEMLRWLKEAGDDVRIITPDDSKDPPTEFLGYPIMNLKGFRLWLYSAVCLSFDFCGKTRELVQDFKPDIVHVTSPGFLIIPALLECYRQGIPIIMSFHTNIRTYAASYIPWAPKAAVKLANFLLRFAHDKADLTLCTSPQLKEECTSFGMRRMDVWQKGINSERFNPSFRTDEMRERLSEGNPDAPLLIYVGRLGLEKKLANLKQVLDSNPGARLALVGKGPAEDGLREHFKGYPVYFAGQMSGDTLSSAYASADIFVMPSDSETLGFVVLEAMASAVPVVGVAKGGVQDLIEDGKNGFLVPNDNNMVDFSARVKQLIDDKDGRDEIALYARKWSERWSWKASASRLRNVQYRAAIQLRKARDEGPLRKHVVDIEEAMMLHYTGESSQTPQEAFTGNT